jgi:flagellar assembly factor FliW
MNILADNWNGGILISAENIIVKGVILMKAETRLFGEVDIPEEKIITFDSGLLGFEDCKKFTIIYDADKGENTAISWLQCMDEPEVAFPVISPFTVMDDYDPIVESELLESLGELKEENIILFALMNIKPEIEKLTANMKAPVIINVATLKGVQAIVENDDYEIKYNIYDVVQKQKQEKGEA